VLAALGQDVRHALCRAAGSRPHDRIARFCHAASAAKKAVRVTGLVSKVVLNGCVFTAQSFDPNTGQYAVEYAQDRRVVAIKGGNLELVENALEVD
jgi:hypothetical protein